MANWAAAEHQAHKSKNESTGVGSDRDIEEAPAAPHILQVVSPKRYSFDLSSIPLVDVIIMIGQTLPGSA